MKFNGRHNGPRVASGGVARLAQSPGMTTVELIKAALQTLLGGSEADRVGVWIDDGESGSHPGRGSSSLRGLVAERNGDSTPSDWERLSLEALSPLDPLHNGKTVEQELDGASDQLILGALLELRRAVWAPIGSHGRLRGVVLAGLRGKHGALPVALVESVSAELALAVELEEERRLASQRQADLAVTSRLLADLAKWGPVDAVFTRLVDSCTETAPGGDGLGAVFAALHTKPDSFGQSMRRDLSPHDRGFSLANHAGGSVHGSRPPHERLTSCWQSGDAAWLHAIDNPPLAGVWRRAEEACDTLVIGSSAGVAWPRGDVARLVAIPLRGSNELLGVLVAGLRRDSVVSKGVERLALRAELAASALALRRRTGEVVFERARQRALLQNDRAATIILEDAGRIGPLSFGAQQLLGEPTGEIAGARALHDAVAPAGQRKFADLFRTPDQPRLETWLQRANSGAPLESGLDDEPSQAQLRSGATVRLRAITQSGTSGNALAAVALEPVALPESDSQNERTEAQLHNVIEWLEEGVVLFDVNHGIRAMNSRFAQIAGLSPEDAARITTLGVLIARMADQAAEPEKFAIRWRDLARGADSGVREEIQLLRPVPRVVERASRPIVGANGERIGRVEIYRDLTAQRVFQSKLLQTEKLAALGQMVTGVAHELSNPLTSILGYAQRLFLRNNSDGQSDEVRQIFQEAERASTILRQLLMSARESRPERRKILLNQIVSRTMELQKFNLAAEQITVELDLDAALPAVMGDSGQLQQVLMNLIGNARQAIEQRGKGGTIRLTTRRAAESVQLEIIDDGPGIPPAIASRIFDPFFTTKPAGIGTGLGLGIVLGIVREHGGQVKVGAPPGGGASFVLEFPALAAVATAEQVPHSHSAVALATGSGFPDRDMVLSRRSPALAPVGASTVADVNLAPWTGARVLVVEDEPTVARLISDVLEDEGLHVDALLDGREALERVAEEDYDLVICDMKMPELDGEHFYKTLAASGNPLSRRFLFVTGDVVATHTHEFLERNQLPHVAKPFRVEELTERVRRVLTMVRPAHPSNSAPARTNVARK
jgi:signal transduction histidine kinase/ActR/RegA family two-component response regulator